MEEQKQELKLILGKMTGKQLAEWFQISYTTYKNKTTKYLKKLENYCSFEKVYGAGKNNRAIKRRKEKTRIGFL